MPVTITVERTQAGPIDSILQRAVTRILFDWTIAAGANDTQGITTQAFAGQFERIVTIPGPSPPLLANYDVVLRDADGADVLAGAGANRSNVLIQEFRPLTVVANSILTAYIATAGPLAQGQLIVYLL